MCRDLSASRGHTRAWYDDGLFEVTMPKNGEAKENKIQVEAGKKAGQGGRARRVNPAMPVGVDV